MAYSKWVMSFYVISMFFLSRALVFFALLLIVSYLCTAKYKCCKESIFIEASIMEYENLCRAVEEKLHRKMHTPADFDYLSDQLQKQIGSSVSSSTLMRLWGYRPSVTVRTNTLDILARFIGYEDYTHFSRACMEGEVQTEDASVVDKEDRQSHSRFRSGYIVGALAIIVACAGFFIFSHFISSKPAEPTSSTTESANEQTQPHFISKLSELSNNRKYFIHTRHDRRGVLGTFGRHPASTIKYAPFYRCEEPSPYALIQHEGKYYLYSVQEELFVNVLLYLTNEPLRQDFGEKNWCAFDIRTEKGFFVFDFKSNSRKYTLNVNPMEGMIIDDWGASKKIYDDGNLFSFEDVGPFDPTEALSMLQQLPKK